MDDEYGNLHVSDAELGESPYVLITRFIVTGYQLIAGIAGLVIIILLFSKGFVWYWESAYPLISVILAFPTVFCFPIGLVLAIFKKTRGISGILILISTVLFFSANWLQALGFAYLYAGKVWMIIGFILAGVGVFFIAFIGALIQGEFMNALLIVVTIAISYAFYTLAMFLIMKHAESTILASRQSVEAK